MTLFDLREGESPLLLSVPHAGIDVPPGIAARFTPEAAHLPDTDWHIPLLYDFAAGMGATILAARPSRYVIDLNRPPDNKPLYPGQLFVPLCPDATFAGVPVYRAGQEPDEAEMEQRLQQFWQPYHDELARQIERIKARHGYAILFDAHSICSILPRLFDGVLPDMNLGTAHGKSCAEGMAQAAFSVAQKSAYSSVLNGRFVGGYITRHYGAPENHVHALQMELTWKTYMNERTYAFEPERAAGLQAVLDDVLDAILAWGRSAYDPARTTPAQGLAPKR